MIVCLLLASTLAVSQTSAAITFRVTDAPFGGKAIEGATLRFRDAAGRELSATVTDARGEAKVARNAGAVEVDVSKSGYIKSTCKVFQDDTQEIVLDQKLSQFRLPGPPVIARQSQPDQTGNPAYLQPCVQVQPQACPPPRVYYYVIPQRCEWTSVQ